MRYILIYLFLLNIFIAHDNGQLLRIETILDLSAPGGVDNECTIMIISGRATDDGRPILWKNRDVTEPDQRYLYIEPMDYHGQSTYGFTGNFYTSDSTRCFMGVNETGFAIINANCYNLPDSRIDGIDDGDLMTLALKWCSAIEDWEHILETSGIYGRRDCWLFGVIDSSGAARLYECGNTSYTVYDANNFIHAPDGYLLRSVFALSGSEPSRGVPRYERAKHLLEYYTENNYLNVKYILQKLARDFSLGSDNEYSHNDPYPLPYYGHQDTLPAGCVITEETINRYKTRSCSVIRGVLQDENPRLATMYAILGQPVLSMAVPLWVGSEYVPFCLRGNEQAPWYSLISQRMNDIYPFDSDNGDVIMNSHYLLDSLGQGVYSWSLELEEWGLSEAETKLNAWRESEFSALDIRQGEIEIVNELWNGFVAQGDILFSGLDDNNELPELIEANNYPNPFNLKTVISFTLAGNSDVNLEVYDILGRKVRDLINTRLESGSHKVIWDGMNEKGEVVSTGVYFYRLTYGDKQEIKPMTLLK